MAHSVELYKEFELPPPRSLIGQDSANPTPGPADKRDSVVEEAEREGKWAVGRPRQEEFSICCWKSEKRYFYSKIYNKNIRDNWQANDIYALG